MTKPAIASSIETAGGRLPKPPMRGGVVWMGGEAVLIRRDMNEPATFFNGLSFLVVEDETVAFMLLEEMLQGLGAASVWRARKVAEALAVLEKHRPNAAVLDINLSGEMVFPVAVNLEEAKIPFIFTTGYGRSLIPPYWAQKLTLQKPFQSEVLAAALNWVIAN